MTENGFKVMVIDDTAENLKVLYELLSEEGYKVSAFPDGEMGLRAMDENQPDLILLDIMMPGLNGYKVISRIREKETRREIPVIFISALNSSKDKTTALKMGGVDYITKPFYPEEVLVRVRTHLKLYALQKELKDYNNQLEKMVEDKVREISEAQKAYTFALARLTEMRDGETGNHVERVQRACSKLAEKLRNKGMYGDIIDDLYIENIFHAASLHDIGKIGVPDGILLKPGKLTEEEFDVIKIHVTLGGSTLDLLAKNYPGNYIIQMGARIARCHHEKWDGTGYMEGLKGEEIPLSARIMAIIDVYDALRSDRPYKEGFSHEKSCEIIKKDLGTHFDPNIGRIFLENHSEFELIHDHWS